MQGELKVEPQKLITASGQFETKAKELKNITNSMLTLASKLNSYWEGDAQRKYTTTFKKLQDDMNRMYKMVREHSTDLKEMANVYKQAESQNVQEAGKLSGDVIV